MPTQKQIENAARKQGISKKEAAKRIFGHLRKLEQEGKKVQ